MSFKNYSLRISVILLFSATLNTEANAAFFSTRGTYEFQDERVVRYEAQGNDVSPLQTFGIGANSTLIDRRVTPSVTASVYSRPCKSPETLMNRWFAPEIFPMESPRN
jgi:hypothetical protein